MAWLFFGVVSVYYEGDFVCQKILGPYNDVNIARVACLIYTCDGHHGGYFLQQPWQWTLHIFAVRRARIGGA